MKEKFDGIIVNGAREHNLKDINVKIPRNKITVITGLSGSGKSSLAFDTIYAEGQRRYIDGLSAYAKQFLDKFKKPEVDSITGLSPSIAIEQKTSSTNPRSTVGTVTEVYDFVRLLFSKLGIPRCPTHGIDVSSQSEEEIVDNILSYPDGSKLILLAPMFRQKKGEFLKEFKQWLTKGFVRAKVDGDYIELDKAKKLQKTKLHDIDLVIDRVVIKDGIRTRLSNSVARAIEISGGRIIIEDFQSKEQKLYSKTASCPICSYSFPDFEDPKFFSFNSPKGYCESCKGIGTQDISEDGESLIDTHDDDLNTDSFEIDEFAIHECASCNGSRLKEDARNIFINNSSIADLVMLPISELINYFENIKLNKRQSIIAGKILKELSLRLSYLDRMGVGYLHLHRPSRSLSGGESQRIRLAAQIGSGLIGILYVLDEPSIGLHPKDHHKLLQILEEIRDKGNTILMVEHDEETIRSADFIYDLGPRAGSLGGNIQAKGNLKEILRSKDSITADYLNGSKTAYLKSPKVEASQSFIKIEKASQNNLKNVSIEIPLNMLCAVTGVSGSGKSTLIIDTLYKYLANEFHKANWTVGKVKKISGLDHFQRVVNINQKPIGRTPRSNPATYVGIFNLIRDLFSQLPEAKIRAYKPGHFSFNVKGGRCEECKGAGRKKLEMNFLANVYVECDTCFGKRYNRDILSITFNNKSIADVLDLTVQEAFEFFEKHPQLNKKLKTLLDVGLDYITLGQHATTLSGGEAQRIKLSKELSKQSNKHTLYILDEPTTGLHFEDVRKLNELLRRLVTEGHSVIVIEHNIDVIKSSDHIIELGPEGGKYGGEIVFHGKLQNLLKDKKSPTGLYIRKLNV